ncbi:damage-inducible mutagenesis protein [Gluconacetobacter diazotrophicus]|uniref:Damage-inducible mutagenesis protein n=1 Tax=Gluconacetobacter diazotrophicus TaxID=33996 RepID=A0A7W4FF86_GLUDI|nr:damage-inducible mutagenesis protein [Gluconacetobacter diazotrophicus]MBB2156655.1 damage-inducible mutagenesis protein [Gluconacetobacter diazotrophicus]
MIRPILMEWERAAMNQHTETMALLREQIARIERRSTVSDAARHLRTGLPDVDRHLGGGLPCGVVHEFYGAGSDLRVAAKPSRFVASILADTEGQIVWISGRYLDLHLAGIGAAGLDAGRVICIETRSENVPGLCEDILRERAVAAVVADLDVPLSLTASRRLQLASEAGGTTGFLLHRESAPPETGRLPPSACQTRWRVRGSPCVLPFSASTALLPLGPERWTIDLLRQRGGGPASWSCEISAHAPSHYLPLASVLAHGPMAPEQSGRADRVGTGAAYA